MTADDFGAGVFDEPDTMTRALGRPVRPLASRGGSNPNRVDSFSAVKNGLDSWRQAFYGTGTNRLPNTNASDLTRRQRTLAGGPGDRHLTQLDLWTERELSRTLRDQSPAFDGMISTWAAEVFQTGWRLKPATGDDDLDTVVKNELFGWDGDGGWCNACDARGMLHLWDLLTLAEETELTDGDHGFYLDPDGNNGRGTVSIIEGDRIVQPRNWEPPDGYNMVNGILMDAAGRPVEVFVVEVAPLYSEMVDVADGQFVDVFDPDNPAAGGFLFSVQPKRYTATRRQPWLSSAVRAHDEIDDVFTAVRVLLRNAACRATYTKVTDWEAMKEWLTDLDAYDGVAPAAPLTHAPNPGDHVILNPGEEGGIWETNAPGENFQPFVESQQNLIGLPLGMCLEESVRIFQKSFSASRMAVEGTRRRYRRRQRQTKRRKLHPILCFAVARLQALGILPAAEECNRVLVGFPGWPYMEPSKDAKASEILANSFIVSRRTSANALGHDYDQEQEYLEQEQALLPAPVAAAPADDNDDDDDESGDE
jgi:capsid protein